VKCTPATRPVKRVLIANRGAIAVRITRTLAAIGITSIAVFADADRQSLHVRAADEAFSLGSGNAGQTYLNVERILEIAQQHRVDAIHPGYGFLSENSSFVRQCEAAGIAFIGPTAEQIEAFGLKHRARQLASEHGVPLLPGTGVLSDQEDAISQATAIGYPGMLKSSAGGGGIGMQLCHSEQELLSGFDSVSQLSQSNFANADLFLEKFVVRARHIEVQIFGDGQGDVISLGERDCSAQRRNQKVLEETPAPSLASAVNYRSAGTVEFIVDAETEDFYFLEVNTRLQVEHGVTEMVYGLDIVQWMIQMAAGQSPLPTAIVQPNGHAIQARIYAEDPARQFQPSAGLLSAVTLPDEGDGRRVDHWIEAGIEVSTFYDPMLAKVIAHARDRQHAIAKLDEQLGEFSIHGIETNIDYLRLLLNTEVISTGYCLTSTLASVLTSEQASGPCYRHAIEVIRAGTMTTIQDYPGRSGYWPVGIPPSGPFDDVSFRQGNRLLGNKESAAGLEMTLDGATLRFLSNIRIALTGAEMAGTLDGIPLPHAKAIEVVSGQTLTLGRIGSSGMRSYLLIEGGLDCPAYLGSRSTFTLGKFGGHSGRTLRAGDVLRLNTTAQPLNPRVNSTALTGLPQIAGSPVPFDSHWQLHVITGPQGSTEFFNAEYLDEFYSAQWSVHFNSSRTGIRLIGPRPDWARSDGGEAGMHPSNLHDNAYAFGTIDFTGDMPVILGPDGPSLGGFVCPATVASADRWKLGQLKAGDTLQFLPVTRDSAIAQLKAQNTAIQELNRFPDLWQPVENIEPFTDTIQIEQGGHKKVDASSTDSGSLNVKIRRAGDCWLLIEFGDMVLDIELRFMAQHLMQVIEQENIDGVLELTPGIRSLQVHFNCLQLSEETLIENIKSCCQKLSSDNPISVPSRIVHLPLSWDDEQCRIAIEKYDQVVRKDAPWYPSNIEFIRRINGLQSVEDVKRIVFDASYLVLGLGDVYLGAPVATPVDPRHRLVTTKYNPARTWTAENSVGIGGSYLCIYGMEGPGGYQFVGRTLQMWNIYRQTTEFKKPWLLRFFDQIKFYPVSSNELEEMRAGFPLGQHQIKIEHTEFNLQQYKQYLAKESGQFQFEEVLADSKQLDLALDEGVMTVESPTAGSVWKLLVNEGDTVTSEQPVVVLESMKMEIEIAAGHSGTVSKILCADGTTVEAGSRLMLMVSVD